jgi:hypothetical protein
MLHIQYYSFKGCKLKRKKSRANKVLKKHLRPRKKNVLLSHNSKFSINLGAKYLVIVSSRSLKMREFSFAQFDNFWEKCAYFSIFEW